MYLRKMGSVSLLTREGEVEIAKRIEEGEQRVLAGRPQLPDRRRGDPRARRASSASSKIRVKDVIRTSTRTTPSSTRSGTTDRICSLIDKVQRARQRDNEKLDEQLDEQGLADGKQEEARRRRSTRTSSEMFEQLEEMRLNKKTIDKIVQQAQGR